MANNAGENFAHSRSRPAYLINTPRKKPPITRLISVTTSWTVLIYWSGFTVIR
ncbi:hypothetical protein IMSAGC019_03677 [Lachnospiraceae bacterium]|nr:hypothetical protein IMSAGC019_03677 [Lachnospiraceae bacterium]